MHDTATEWQKTAPAEIWIENVKWESGRRNHVWTGNGNDPGAPYDAVYYVRAGQQRADDGGDDTAAGLAAALRDVMEWIGNWSPNFVYDEEWPKTEAKVRAVLATAARRGL
jgi:hypothetical protein